MDRFRPIVTAWKAGGLGRKQFSPPHHSSHPPISPQNLTQSPGPCPVVPSQTPEVFADVNIFNTLMGHHTSSPVKVKLREIIAIVLLLLVKINLYQMNSLSLYPKHHVSGERGN